MTTRISRRATSARGEYRGTAKIFLMVKWTPCVPMIGTLLSLVWGGCPKVEASLASAGRGATICGMKWITLLLCLVLPTLAFAGNVSVKLIADHSDVKVGESFQVGVLFDIKNDWHIYWKFPGDSGMPPSVKWTLPDGFEVGELMWPAPVSFAQPGELAAYGYSGKVMLMAVVTPPPTFNGPAEISAKVKWLECKEVCVPGKTEVSTVVQVEVSERESAAETFKEWSARLPVESKDVVVKRDGLKYELTMPAASDGAEVEVFPAPPEGVEVKSIKKEGKKVAIEFAAMEGSTPAGKAEVVLKRGTQAYRVLLSMDKE